MEKKKQLDTAAIEICIGIVTRVREIMMANKKIERPGYAPLTEGWNCAES